MNNLTLFSLKLLNIVEFKKVCDKRMCNVVIMIVAILIAKLYRVILVDFTCHCNYIYY